MKKLTTKQIGKLPPHPVFKTLPDSLKDVSCFHGIEEELAKMMHSDHTHASVKSFVRCIRCSAKLHKKRERIKELGFDNHEQYLLWRNVMTIIKDGKNIELR